MKTSPNHIAGNTLTQNLNLTADVVIVGSGAGGGLAANLLTEAGFKVIVVEEGPYQTKEDFKFRESDSIPHLYQDAGSRGTKDKGMLILQGRCVGGGTTINWTTSIRTPKQTLAHWHDEYGIEGITDAEMSPWFEQVEAMMNVIESPFEPNTNNAKLAQGLEKLGWEVSHMKRNVKDCGNLGYCGVGCVLDAKQSQMVVSIPKVLERGSHLLSRVRAEKFIFDSNNNIQKLECVGLQETASIPTGKKITLNAKHFVLSGGAINSPALLLRSNAPDPHKTLGKRTFLHPTNFVSGIMPERIDGWRGAPQTIYSDEFLWKDGTTGKAGFKLEVPPMQPGLISSLFGMYGADHADYMKQLPFMHIQVALLRDGFHPDSTGGTVSLRKDGSPELDYPLNDYFWDGILRSWLAMAESLFAAGAKTARISHVDGIEYKSFAEAKAHIPTLRRESGYCTLGSAHVMGGCTMGKTPEKSVVNSHGRHHQIPNLSVLDGSVFPTSIGANPQVSIYAMTAKNTMKLIEDLKRA